MQLLVLALIFCLGNSKVYFIENSGEGYQDRWIQTKNSSVQLGVLSRELKRGIDSDDYCLKMMNDSSYYRFSSAFSEPLDLSKNDLFFQFQAAYTPDMDCGGSYFKLYSGLDQDALTSDTPYSIMFGPDVCGFGTRKIHLILNHKDVNYDLKNLIQFELDSLPHFFELFIGADGTFSVKVDSEEKASGSLDDSFNYLLPKLIDDPTDKKPEDWVEDEMMDDPEDKKPDDWDDRRNIVDETAVKPDDWDDATDGEWEPDLKENPAYKGDWTAKKIPNSKFQGIWKAKQISNPDYKSDDTFAKYKLTNIAFECWTVKSKTEFDNIVVTDDKDEAKKFAEITLKEVNDQKSLIKKAEEAQRKPADSEEEKGKDKPIENEEQEDETIENEEEEAHEDL